MPNESRIYAVDKDLNVVSYKLLISVLEYQTAVMRRDFDTADKVIRKPCSKFLSLYSFTVPTLPHSILHNIEQNITTLNR